MGCFEGGGGEDFQLSEPVRTLEGVVRGREAKKERIGPKELQCVLEPGSKAQ